MKLKDIVKIAAGVLLFSVLSTMLCFPTFAAAEIQFRETVRVKDGGILYEIHITEKAGVSGLSLELRYSEEQAALKNCTVGEILGDGMAKANSDLGGKVLLTYVSLTPLNRGGTLISLELDPVSTDNETVDISCQITECIDSDCNDIAYGYTKAEIKNPLYVPADTKETVSSREPTVPPTVQPSLAAPVTDEPESPVTEATKPTAGSEEAPVLEIEPTVHTEETEENPKEEIPWIHIVIPAICLGLIVLVAIIAKKIEKGK